MVIFHSYVKLQAAQIQSLKDTSRSESAFVAYSKVEDLGSTAATAWPMSDAGLQLVATCIKVSLT